MSDKIQSPRGERLRERCAQWSSSLTPFEKNCMIGLVVILTLAVMSFFFVDGRVTIYCQKFQGTPFRSVVSDLSKSGESTWYIIGGLAVFLLSFWWNKLLASRAAYLFVTVTVTGLAAKGLKSLLGRPRPRLFLEDGSTAFRGYGHDFTCQSMPSGHATTVAAAAMALAIMFPRFRVPILIAGVLLAFGRVITLDHFVSDVLAGIVLGAAGSLAFARCFTLRKKDD